MQNTSAEVLVTRVVTTLLAVATLVFLLLTWVPLTAETDSLLYPWQLTCAVVVFGVPLIIGALAFTLRLGALRVMLGCYAVAFTLVVVTFVPAMTTPMLPDHLAPWPVLVTAIGTVPAALAWRSWWAWGWVVGNSVLIAPVRYFAAGNTDLAAALQYSFFTITFAGIFTGLTIVALSNGRALDAATVAARATAASAAAAVAREREQSRLDALVHDEVISTLFYASQGRAELAASVSKQARDALAHLSRLREPLSADAEPVATEEFVSRMQSVVTELCPGVMFSVRSSRTLPVPADVAATFAEATAEAVRNSIVHAGDRATVKRSTTVVVTDARIRASVLDDGKGFDPSAVPSHRLGIAVSIRGRFDAIAGGRATVTSRVGGGTRILLEWIPE